MSTKNCTSSQGTRKYSTNSGQLIFEKKNYNRILKEKFKKVIIYKSIISSYKYSLQLICYRYTKN